MPEETPPPMGDPFASVVDAIATLAEAISTAIAAPVLALADAIATMVDAAQGIVESDGATVLPLPAEEQVAPPLPETKETEQDAE